MDLSIQPPSLRCPRNFPTEARAKPGRSGPLQDPPEPGTLRVGPGWYHNGDVLSYVCWYWPEQDRWNYDELDTDWWSLRHVELHGDGRVIAAASLVEVLAVHDSGGAGTVVRYERRYGVVPDAPFAPPDADVELVNVSCARRPRLISSRSARVSRPGPGCHESDRTVRFGSRRTTVRTTSCEHPTCRPISRSDRPFALSRRANRRCFTVRWAPINVFLEEAITARWSG